jgi:hypothetical protein
MKQLATLRLGGAAAAKRTEEDDLVAIAIATLEMILAELRVERYRNSRLVHRPTELIAASQVSLRSIQLASPDANRDSRSFRRSFSRSADL